MAKKFIEFDSVVSFIAGQSDDAKIEYHKIVDMLENSGRLSMPFGEKLPRKNMFVIRVIHAANFRVFYVYGKGDFIYGISAYEKKTQTIPIHEMKHALKIASELKARGLI